jgi:hypothetical protein
LRRPVGECSDRDESAARSVCGWTIISTVRVLRDSDEEEMVAVFLRGELSSERFAPVVRGALVALDRSPELITDPDLTDAEANRAPTTTSSDWRATSA